MLSTSSVVPCMNYMVHTPLFGSNTISSLVRRTFVNIINNVRLFD